MVIDSESPNEESESENGKRTLKNVIMDNYYSTFVYEVRWTLDQSVRISALLGSLHDS